MIISEMNVKLTASTAAFARAMDKAGGKVKKFRKSVGKVAGSMKALGPQAAAAAAVLTGIAWGAKKVFALGASIEETGSKFRTVFGPEASAEVTAFLDTFANKAGLTTNEAKGLVATTGAIAQGLGFTQKASGDMAIEITKLAGDLSSFNNLPTEQVLMGINSALTGEREQMKQLGIVVQEADVQARAFANTGKTVAKTLTQQEKATATLQIITEKAGSAVGDLDRTAGSAANVFKRLKARFLEIRDAIATALMPAFTDILDGMEKNEGKFIEFKQSIIDNSATIAAWASVFVAVLKVVGVALIFPLRLVGNLAQNFVNLFQAAKALLTGDWEGFKQEVIESVTNMRQVGEALINVGAAGVDAWKAIGEAVFGVKEKVGGLKTDIEGVGTAAQQAGEEGADGLDPFVSVVEQLNEKLTNLSESFAKNFVGRMTEAAQGGKEAFKGYFDYMKRQLIDLAMKALVFRAIMGIGKKFGFDMSKVGSFATSMSGFKPATGGGETGTGAPGAGTPILSGRAANASRGGIIVNQNINFTVSAIDGRSAARFIKEQGGTIAEVIATAAKDSTAYRRQLQGA